MDEHLPTKQANAGSTPAVAVRRRWGCQIGLITLSNQARLLGPQSTQRALMVKDPFHTRTNAGSIPAAAISCSAAEAARCDGGTRDLGVLESGTPPVLGAGSRVFDSRHPDPRTATQQATRAVSQTVFAGSVTLAVHRCRRSPTEEAAGSEPVQWRFESSRRQRASSPNGRGSRLRICPAEVRILPRAADVVESAVTLDSKSSASRGVRVQLSPSAVGHLLRSNFRPLGRMSAYPTASTAAKRTIGICQSARIDWKTDPLGAASCPSPCIPGCLLIARAPPPPRRTIGAAW